jgi:hypothetical protein
MLYGELRKWYEQGEVTVPFAENVRLITAKPTKSKILHRFVTEVLKVGKPQLREAK